MPLNMYIYNTCIKLTRSQLFCSVLNPFYCLFFFFTNLAIQIKKKKQAERHCGRYTRKHNKVEYSMCESVLCVCAALWLQTDQRHWCSAPACSAAQRRAHFLLDEGVALGHLVQQSAGRGLHLRVHGPLQVAVQDAQRAHRHTGHARTQVLHLRTRQTDTLGKRHSHSVKGFECLWSAIGMQCICEAGHTPAVPRSATQLTRVKQRP